MGCDSLFCSKISFNFFFCFFFFFMVVLFVFLIPSRFPNAAPELTQTDFLCTLIYTSV